MDRLRSIVAVALVCAFAGAMAGCKNGPQALTSSTGAMPPVLSPDSLSGIGPGVVTCGSNFISTNIASITLLVNHDSPNTLTIADSSNGQTATLSATPPASGQTFNTPSGEYYTTVNSNTLPNQQVRAAFDTILIQAPNGFTQGAAHSYAITEQNVTAALTVNVTYMASTNVAYGSNNLAPVPPQGCGGTIPGAPSLSVGQVGGVGATNDAVMQWLPVWWTMNKNGSPDGCSESDTYVLQISPNQAFPSGPVGQSGVYTQTGEIAETVFNMPATGAPNTGNPPLIPNPGNSPPGLAQATVCQKGSNGSLTPQTVSGLNPLAVNWAFATSPDYAQANTVLWGNGGGASSCSSEPSMFFRVRAGYDNDLGPWSQPASFTIPCPVQFMPNTSNATAASQCPFKSGSSAECLAWEPVRDAVGYFVRVAPDVGTALPASGQAPGEIDFTVGTGLTVGGNTPDPNEPQCIVVGQAVTPTVWCGLWKGSTQTNTQQGPFNLAAGSMQRWDVRANYGTNVQLGPWSPDFRTTW
jgi:hypothetical protein